MRTERGFGLLAYLIAGAAVLALLGALYVGIRADGYKAGAADVQGRWDRQVAADIAYAARRRADQAATARRHSAELGQAQQEARDNHQLWREAREDARRKGTALAVCGRRQQPPGAAATSVSSNEPHGDDGLQLRLTWQFVGLWDSAWTGEDGKPVHGDPGGVLARARQADPAAPSPYSADDVLDNHHANAEACSADRRLLAKLTALIKDLRARWDAVK